MAWILFNTETAPAIGLYFTLNGGVYLPGDSIPIADIGTIIDPHPGLSLVCVTRNVNRHCCRTSDGGNIGEWHFPNGSIVPRNRVSPHGDFSRSGYDQEVRLNRRNHAMMPLGVYSCRVPNEGGDIISANITLTAGMCCRLKETYGITYTFPPC